MLYDDKLLAVSRYVPYRQTIINRRFGLPQGYEKVLGASRTLLQILRVLNLIAGVIAIVALPLSFVFAGQFQDFFTNRRPHIDAGWMLPTLRVWLVLALGMVAASHVMFSRLLAIVGTVRAGDPFVADNAVRLKTIAWCLLWLQVLHLTFGLMASIMNAAGSSIQFNFSPTGTLIGWATVFLVFVLARVFDEGARIRTDLETMI
jgi:hypothetical protein